MIKGFFRCSKASWLAWALLIVICYCTPLGNEQPSQKRSIEQVSVHEEASNSTELSILSSLSSAMALSLKRVLQGMLLAPLAVAAKSSTAHKASSTTTSYRPLFTVPDAATVRDYR